MVGPAGVGTALYSDRSQIALRMIAPIPGGSPWAKHPREGQLVGVHRSGDELFLRYRFGGIGS